MIFIVCLLKVPDFLVGMSRPYLSLAASSAAAGAETTTRVKRVNAVMAITRLMSINTPCAKQSLGEELRVHAAGKVEIPVECF
jgi:hypothetical protein